MANISIDWKFFAMLLAAAASVIVPVFLWQFDLTSHSLSVRLVSSTALQPETSPAVQDLLITLDGVKIESPYLSTLELTNDGSKPVFASDFESPLEIGLIQDRQVVRARIANSQPNGISATLVPDTHSVKLQPLLLNPNDSLAITIITSGGQPVFTPHARIAGVSKVSYEDATTKKIRWKQAAILLPIAVFSFILYMLFAGFLIQPGMPIARPLVFSSMLLCIFSASSTLIRALEALEIEASILNLTAFGGISMFFALPLHFRQMRKSRTK